MHLIHLPLNVLPSCSDAKNLLCVSDKSKGLCVQSIESYCIGQKNRIIQVAHVRKLQENFYERTLKSIMLRYTGHPKSSALFYWSNTSAETLNKPFFASFLTVSPVELHEEEQVLLDQLHFSYPIMIHEPIPVQNIDKIIQDARERNATIVDCGMTNSRNIRIHMKNALAEYLNAYISYHFEMEHKQEKILETPKDINFLELKNKLINIETSDKIRVITQLAGAIRALLDSEKDMKIVSLMSDQMEKLRLTGEYDFDTFLHIVKVPGKIANKISELYIKQFYNIAAKNKDLTCECRKDIASLFTLKRLDELREQTRIHINNKDINKAIHSIEQIYKIKESNPPFTSGEDLDQFCKALIEEGSFYDELSSKYIEKYFLVIDKKFKEAGEVHKEICNLQTQK